MSDNGNYETYVEALRTSAGLQDETRITQGEIAAVIASEYGTLKQAAIDAHIEYKTLAEYRRVVEFYEILPGRNLIGGSDVRRIMATFDTLRWTHLRLAASLRDYEEAMDALTVAANEAQTPQQFKRYLARLNNGHRKPSRYVVDNGRGLRITIERYA